MVFARTLSWIALAALLSGCAIPSTNFSKDPATQQALVKCRAQAGAHSGPSPNPFAVTADQNQYVIDCMKAAGYTMQ
jgi:hypothetical protein